MQFDSPQQRRSNSSETQVRVAVLIAFVAGVLLGRFGTVGNQRYNTIADLELSHVKTEGKTVITHQELPQHGLGRSTETRISSHSKGSPRDDRKDCCKNLTRCLSNENALVASSEVRTEKLERDAEELREQLRLCLNDLEQFREASLTSAQEERKANTAWEAKLDSEKLKRLHQEEQLAQCMAREKECLLKVERGSDKRLASLEVRVNQLLSENYDMTTKNGELKKELFRCEQDRGIYHIRMKEAEEEVSKLREEQLTST